MKKSAVDIDTGIEQPRPLVSNDPEIICFYLVLLRNKKPLQKTFNNDVNKEDLL